MPKIKVFRTAIGFHDAYVAAASRKAALAAWGSDRDLFARGVAEQVADEDEEGAQAALAEPGTVIRRSRGTRAEQIAALPPTRPRKGAAKAKGKGKRAPAPPPDRSALDAAEAAVAAAEREQRTAAEAVRGRIAALEADYRALRKTQAAEMEALEAARREADAAYRDTLNHAGD